MVLLLDYKIKLNSNWINQRDPYKEVNKPNIKWLKITKLLALIKNNFSSEFFTASAL